MTDQHSRLLTEQVLKTQPQIAVRENAHAAFGSAAEPSTLQTKVSKAARYDAMARLLICAPAGELGALLRGGPGLRQLQAQRRGLFRLQLHLGLYQAIESSVAQSRPIC